MSNEGLHPADEKHEQRDVHRATLAIFAICFAGFVTLAVLTLWITYGAGGGGFAAAQPRQSLPADGELGQGAQLANYLEAQQAYLDKLGWTDDSHSHAKLPIADAMRLLAAKGPNRPQAGEAQP
jgi:hypothetical protein